MEVTLFPAQLFGMYFIAIGIASLLKGKELAESVDAFRKSPLLTYVGAFLVMLGLSFVILHNVWDGTWRVVITVIAWLTLLEGLAYLWLPQKAIGKLINWFNTRWWYVVATILSFALGAFLVVMGFGGI